MLKQFLPLGSRLQNDPICHQMNCIKIGAQNKLLLTLNVWTALHIHNCQYGTHQDALHSLGREPISLLFSYLCASWASDRCLVVVNCWHPHSLTLQWLCCSETLPKEVGCDTGKASSVNLIMTTVPVSHQNNVSATM